jgi:serine/threonine protein kinase
MDDIFSGTQLMKACPICARLFDHTANVCSVDGYELVTQVEEDPLIGTWLLDRYVILSVIGAGGWARVYKARHLTLGTLVAIKTLHTHFMSNREKVQRFEQEAKAACGLRHENIATVYDYGSLPNGQPFIIMDLLEGRSLQSLLEESHVLPPQRAVQIFKQICAGLAAAHDHGIVHRDIKPSNIVLLPDPDRGELVKLFDFGLAKLKMDDGTSINQFTKTGETVGTPAYMSPEQCQGWKLDHRTDIYSLGCVMYECLTGVRAFSGSTMYESMSKHVLEVAPPFHEVAPHLHIPAELEDMVFRALEKEPRRRYQTARKLLSDLSKLEESDRLSGSKSTLQSLTLRRPMRLLQRTAHKYRRTTVLAATTMVLLVASCLLFYQGMIEFDPSHMSLSERWLFYMQKGLQALNDGDYQPALSAMTKATGVADSFSTRERKRISLANQALIYHLLRRSDKEHAVALQEADLVQTQAEPAATSGNQLKPGEAGLLSAMLDALTSGHAPDKQQLQLLSQRIIDVGTKASDPAAVKLFQKNCQILDKFMGAENETYVMASEQLAGVLSATNQRQQALDAWLKCMAVARKVLPPSDARLPRILSEAATELERNDKLADAEQYFSEAMRLRANDPQWMHRYASISDLARVYASEGKYEQAYEQWMSLLPLIDQNAGADCDAVILQLAYCSDRVHKNKETEKVFKTRKESLITQNGKYAEGVAAYCLGLAELALMETKFDQARKEAMQALEIRQLAQVPGSAKVRRALDMAVRVALAQKRYKDALPLQSEVLAIAEVKAPLDKDQAILFEDWCKLAYMQSQLNMPTQATESIDQMRAILATMQSAQSAGDCPQAINPFFSALPASSLTAGDYDKLAKLLQSPSDGTSGDKLRSPSALVDDALSRVYFRMNKLAEAEAEAKTAAAALDGQHQLSPWIDGRVLRNYAVILRKQGKNSEAQRVDDEAMQFPSETI